MLALQQLLQRTPADDTPDRITFALRRVYALCRNPSVLDLEVTAVQAFNNTHRVVSSADMRRLFQVIRQLVLAGDLHAASRYAAEVVQVIDAEVSRTPPLRGPQDQ